eukprot:6178314-Pleurochrysis_carterae.AAC.1
MRGALEKCKKLMVDKRINEGVIHVNQAIRSMEPPGRQTNLNTREEKELALRQLTHSWHHTRMARSKRKGQKSDNYNHENVDSLER